MPPGSTVMDAAHALGIYVPHFCYHKKLSIAANCRMCLVQVEKAPKPLPACATPAAEGMKVWTASELAVTAQKSVMEFLLINHPLDCPICDQGGECQLQDLAVGYGPSASRYTEEKRVVFHKNLGPLVAAEEMARCIQCTRCVRFGQEIAGVMELGMIGRGEHAEIVSFVGKTVDSELSGNMIDICPVGALTSKPFRYAARTWELSRRKSVSPHDALGSNLVVQVKGDSVLRVLPLENEAVNECWISDKDRFSYEALASDDRLAAPMIQEGGEWKTVDWQTALDARRRRPPRDRRRSTAPTRSARSCRRIRRSRRWRSRRSSRAGSARTTSTSGCASPISAATARGRAFPGSACRSPSSTRSIACSSIGSFLRKDHPLIAQRLRQAAKKGAQISLLHSVADDSLIRVAHSFVAPPSMLPQALAEIVVAAAHGAGKPVAGGARRHRADGGGAGDRGVAPFGRAQGGAARQRRGAASRGVAAPRARAGARRADRREARLPHGGGEQRRRLRCRRAAAIRRHERAGDARRAAQGLPRPRRRARIRLRESGRGARGARKGGVRRRDVAVPARNARMRTSCCRSRRSPRRRGRS